MVLLRNSREICFISHTGIGPITSGESTDILELPLTPPTLEVNGEIR